MWTDYFDKIYVINLAKRTDRMQQAKEQLDKYSIPFERWEAIENLDGAEGLRLTMIELFTYAINSGYQNVLVFEDDVDFLESDMNNLMEEIVQQIPYYEYDIVYLGCQLCKMPEFYWRNLLRIKDAYATHAAIYSGRVMKEIIGKQMKAPIDNWLVSEIQKNGRCFATYPLLASQIVSKSDIYSDAEFIDWKPHLEIKYNRQIEKMKEMGKFIREPKNN